MSDGKRSRKQERRAAERARLSRELAESSTMQAAQGSVGQTVTVVSPDGRSFRALVTALHEQGGAGSYWSMDLTLTVVVPDAV